MRRAFTLIEVLLILALIAILTAITVPRSARQLDRIRVRGAATEAVTALAAARHAAIRRDRRTAVSFDRVHSRIVVHADHDTLLTRDLARTHQVSFTTTRDSLAYRSDGLGYGAANLTMILTRGTAAETVVVSRLGRVRR